MRDLFSNISEKNKCKILQSLDSTTNFYKKNNIIPLRENIIGLVEDGSIEIVKNDYNGNSKIIESYSKGDMFDSITLPIINDDYDIIIKNDATLSVISYNEIFKNYDINDKIYNEFLKNILVIMTLKMAYRNERIEILINKTIRDRLLDYFKILSKKNNSRSIYLPFSYTELAEYLAIDRSAMNRELKNLKDENLIETNGRFIKLLYYF